MGNTPLYPDAVDLIRRQLDQLRDGRRVQLIAIGCLTESQHLALREYRASRNLAGGESPEIVYLGRHHHESRSAQGYTVEDMVLQVQSGLAADAAPFLRGSMTSLWAIHARDDGYGKRVRDQAVFELMARKPRFELYSVIPKGDGRQKRQSPRSEGSACEAIHRVTCFFPTADHLGGESTPVPQVGQGETVPRVAGEKETPGQRPGVEAGPCGPAGVALTSYRIRTSPTRS